MNLQYFPVREDLRDFIGAYYLFETAEAAYQPICAELGNIRFILDGGGDICWPDGRRSPFPPASITGPTMSAYAIDVRAGTRALGIGVLPYGWDALFGVSAHLFLDRIDNLESHFGDLAAQMHAEMSAATSGEELAAVADRLLGARLLPRKSALRPFPAAFETWLLNPDVQDLDEFLEMLGLSHRQADRLAKHYFGASPKALQRKYRALHALTRMALGEADNWADAGGDLFYDQSHFIKEFKTFVGQTPQDFLRHKPILLAQSIALRARATHKPAISENDAPERA